MRAQAEISESSRHLEPRSEWSRTLLIFAVFLFSYAYFYQGGGWNQNSRFDLIRAILDQHTLRIDSYHENTGDKAYFQGHYYSDKAPGQAFLALPFVAMSRPAMRVLGVNSGSTVGVGLQSYVATLFASSIPMALGVCCLYWLAVKLGCPPKAAVFAAVSMGLASPIWAYATMLLGHTLAASCLLFAFAAAIMLEEPNSNRRLVTLGLAVGLAAGWATVTEYPAAPAAAILAIFALLQVWRCGWAARRLTATGIAIGALACLAVLLAYQDAAFGSPFRLGYAHYQSGDFPWMQSGFVGVTYPRPLILLKLLFGGHLGLFLLSPVMIAAPFGLLRLWHDDKTRSLAAVAAAVPLYYWLFNGSFSGWHGGNSYGPRYMLAGIPILCIGLAPVYVRATNQRRRWLRAAMTWGLAMTLMAEATTVQPPQMMRFPLFKLIWPSFWSGHFSINHVSMLIPADCPEGRFAGAFNLGELAGLHGIVSLLPLLAVWGAGVFLWRKLERAERSP